MGFAQYLTYFSEALPIGQIAIALALVLVGLNYYGAAEASKIEDAIVLTLLLLIVLFVAGGVPTVEGSRLRPFNPNGWAAVLATTGTIYVSFIGFAVIATAAAEIENPARNLPLAMVMAVVVPTVLYVLVMIVSTGVLPADQLQESRVPVAAVAAEYAGSLGALAMVGGAALARCPAPTPRSSPPVGWATRWAESGCSTTGSPGSTTGSTRRRGPSS